MRKCVQERPKREEEEGEKKEAFLRDSSTSLWSLAKKGCEACRVKEEGSIERERERDGERETENKKLKTAR